MPAVRFVRFVRPLAIGAVLAGVSASPALGQPSPTTTPAELLAGYAAAVGTAGSAERGEKFFRTNFGKEMGWSCASCHTTNPARAGRHDATDKAIKPLAPAANAARFTDRRQVEFYFKLNCKDVVGRECTAQEKADVLAWLLSVR